MTKICLFHTPYPPKGKIPLFVRQIMIRGKFPLIVMWSGSTIRGKIHGPKKSDSPIRNADCIFIINNTEQSWNLAVSMLKVFSLVPRKRVGIKWHKICDLSFLCLYLYYTHSTFVFKNEWNFMGEGKRIHNVCFTRHF